jgi:XTP/dITP diphosphohydrolase
MITFVSGNQEKIKKARAAFDAAKIEFTSTSIELVEIQSYSGQDVAEDKAMQAFEKVKGEVLVNDASWRIPSLQDFPGPYMKQVNTWLTVEDWMHLMQSKQNRTIVMTEYVSFFNGSLLKTFTQSHTGHILAEVSSILLHASPVDNIATFTEDKQTLAQRREKNLSAFPDDTAIWNDFTQWYLEK